MSTFSDSLQRGLNSGFGIGETLYKRDQERAKQADIDAAMASGKGFATAADSQIGRANLMAAYAKHGDAATGVAIDEHYGNQMKQKMTEGLQQLNALARTGTPEAMQQAAVLMPQVWSYLPNGNAMQAAYDPAKHGVMSRHIDEKTGQEIPDSGRFSDPKTLQQYTDSLLMTVPELNAQDLAQGKFAEEKRHAGVEEGQGQQRLGLEKEQIGVARSQVAATREANQQLAGYRQDELSQRKAEHFDVVATKAYELHQDADKFNAEMALKGKEFSSQDAERSSNIMRNVATADSIYFKMLDGTPEWTPQTENAAQNILSAQIKMEQTANPGIVGDGSTARDPAATARDAWGIMHANPPGAVNAGEAVSMINDLKADPKSYGVKQPNAGSAPAQQGLVQITNLHTGRSVLVPGYVALSVLGPTAVPTAPSNRMSATGAPPMGPGAIGVPDQRGASGGY